MKPLLLLWMSVQAAAPSLAPDTAGHGRTPPVARAVPAAVAPRVDGHLDDPAWREAPVMDGFRRTRPGDGAPASEHTEVRVTFTREALYVGARLSARDGGTVSRLRGRRDSFGLFNDQFLVMLDSQHDHRTAYVFGVTPAGGRNDLIAPNDSESGMDMTWDPVWEAATRVDSAGWTAEIRIPFTQLRFAGGGAAPVWGVQFRRDIVAAGEVVDWAWTPPTEPGFASRFGHLEGLLGLEAPDRLEILPYTVASGSFDARADPTSPFDDGSVYGLSGGLDLKYGLTGSLTLDATFNPDFGQVEADPAVVNLSAFEQFFEERRPFFVEGASAFDFGGLSSMRFFYTRRVGRAPSLGASGLFVDAPSASTILGAAKVSGRTPSGWTVGVLNATTDREHARVIESPGGPVVEVPVEPRTNLSVVRVRRDFNASGSEVGLIVTNSLREQGGPAFDVLRDGAVTGGIDFVRRWGNRAHALRGWVGASHVRGPAAAILRAQRSSARFFQRPDQDHLELDPESTALGGWGAELELVKEAGDWIYSLNGQSLSPGFELNDAGFQNQADRHVLFGLLRRRWLSPSATFRSLRVSGQAFSFWDFGGTRTGTNVRVDLSGQTQGFRSFDLALRRDLEALSTRETRGGPRMVQPAGWFVSGGVSSDDRRGVSGGLRATWTESEVGSWSVALTPSLAGRGSGWWSWSVAAAYRRSEDDAFYVTQAADAAASATFGARYLFAGLERESLEATLRVDLALTPALTVQLYAQPFVSNGDYEAFRALRRPASYDFLPYGSEGSTLRFDEGSGRYSADADGPGPAPALAFADPDFRVRSLRGNLVVRWEYRPGSTLFLVWSQSRSDRSTDPTLEPWSDLGRAWGDPGRNVFLIKANYWLGS